MHIKGQAGLNVKGINCLGSKIPQIFKWHEHTRNPQGTYIFHSPRTCKVAILVRQTKLQVNESYFYRRASRQSHPITFPPLPPPTPASCPIPPSPHGGCALSLLSCELLCHITKASLLTSVIYVISSPVRSPQKGIIQLILTIFNCKTWRY